MYLKYIYAEYDIRLRYNADPVYGNSSFIDVADLIAMFYRDPGDIPDRYDYSFYEEEGFKYYPDY